MMMQSFCSQKNSFPVKLPLMKTLKSSFHVNHLLKLQICEPKLKPYISRELLHKKSTNSRVYISKPLKDKFERVHF